MSESADHYNRLNKLLHASTREYDLACMAGTLAELDKARERYLAAVTAMALHRLVERSGLQ